MNTIKKLTALAAGAVMVSAVAASAATVTATASTGVVPGYGTTLGSASWTVGDAPATVTGNSGGQYRSPVGDTTTPYFTVGTPSIPSSASPAVLNMAARDTFRMLWGSIDIENAVVFSNGATSVQYTGEFIRTLLNPDGVAGTTNAIVTFDLDFDFTTVSFFANYSTGETPPVGTDRAAFEFQVAAVPVPAAAFLLVTALAGLGMVARRKAA